MKIQKVLGRTFHLAGKDIDTDRIIPARFLKCVTFDGLGEQVFKDDRQALNGEHPFDHPVNKGREILIADQNFGSGSSREHAVAALERWGIKAIIALSFAQIFRTNATANGMVCVDLTAEDHATLIKKMSDSSQNSVTIDLVNMMVGMGTRNKTMIRANMPAGDRDMLIKGEWDTTATLLEAGALIEATISRLDAIKAA